MASPDFGKFNQWFFNGWLDQPLSRLTLFFLAFGAIFLGIDPIENMFVGLPSEYIFLIAALAVALCGYKLLEYGSNTVVNNATALVTANDKLPKALIAGVIALGTSLSELGFVITTSAKHDYEVMIHSIIGSDGFQLGGIFFLCVWFARTTAWDAKLLRVDMGVLSAMTAAVLAGMVLGFSRPICVIIVVTALVSLWLFVKDTPSDIKEAQCQQDACLPAAGLKGIGWAFLDLMSGFSLLLLGTVWFYDAIMFAGQEVLGLPAFILGVIAAIVTSLGEVFTTIPLIRKGEQGLSYAVIALAGSNACDTGIMGIALGLTPVMVKLDFTPENLLPAAVTMGLTLLILWFTTRKQIPRWAGYVTVPAYGIFLIALPLLFGS